MSQSGRAAGAAGARGSRLAVVLGVCLALVLPACNKKSTSPTPVATPTPAPARAVVTIAILNAHLEVVSPAPDKQHPGFYNQLIYTLHVVESGGVGCSLNYVRLEVYALDGTLLERTEQGPTAFTGGNRLDAGHTRDFTVFSGFNSDLKRIYLVISVGTTDDRGNTQTSVSGNLVIG